MKVIEDDDKRAQAQRLKQFSMIVSLAALTFAPGQILLGWFIQSQHLLVIGVQTLVSAGFFVFSWKAAAKEHISTGVTALALGFFLAVISGTIVAPSIAPVVILLPLIIVLLGLPYSVGSKYLQRLIIASWIVSVLVFIFALFVAVFPPLPQLIEQLLVLGAGPIVVGLALLLQWQYRGRLLTIIGELKTAKETLEEQVAERTAELAAALAQTERARADAELARKAAEEANQLKTQFLANMSHELRTPLNAVLNFTERVTRNAVVMPADRRLKDFVDGELSLSELIVAHPPAKDLGVKSARDFSLLSSTHHDILLRSYGSADHLLGLINDILDLSKIEAGKMELFPEAVDLTAMLESVKSTALGLLKDKPVDLVVEIDGVLPTMTIDKTRVRQVLLNLLSNAAKFTEQGRIAVRARNNSQGFVALSVQDTGLGIDPAHHDKIFQQFQQVEGGLHRKYQGTGLGLPISKRFVELHGGTMWLESALGQGATFFFTLPLPGVTKAQQLIGAGTTAHAEGLLSELGASVQQRIVVIDDDPNAHEVVRGILGPEGEGYNLISLFDSRLAVRDLLNMRDKPDLILLDIQMPHVDGWEILAQLKEYPELASIPVIICSILENQRIAKALGVRDYLVKPIRGDVLLQTVQHWLVGAGTILVVDDARDDRDIIRGILEPDFRVIEATGGVPGLALVEAQRPDLVILDLMMPDMDGFAVLEQLRLNPLSQHLPIIILSAKDLSAEERAWLRERSQAYLAKSQFSGESFRTLIKTVLPQQKGAGT